MVATFEAWKYQPCTLCGRALMQPFVTVRRIAFSGSLTDERYHLECAPRAVLNG